MRWPVIAAAGALSALPHPPTGAHAGGSAPAAAPVDFVRDIQPIFQAACYKCHGPEKRQGQLRMDARATAMKGGGTGAAIIPGNGKGSLLYKYLIHDDPDERMPRKADPLPKA